MERLFKAGDESTQGSVPDSVAQRQAVFLHAEQTGADSRCEFKERRPSWDGRLSECADMMSDAARCSHAGQTTC